MTRLAAWGVDGIISNNPRVLVQTFGLTVVRQEGSAIAAIHLLS